MARHYFPLLFQTKVIATIIREAFQALFLDCGLGKTVIILRAYYSWKKKGQTKGMLIIAPLRPCYTVWPKEVKKWRFSSTFKVEILHGNDKLNALRRKADIYVINPEGMKWLFTVALKGKRNWPFDVLVIDESGKFKNPDSKRLKLLKPRLKKFTRRYVLNGTPAPNSLLDIWGQLLLVDAGALFGTRITHFRNMYFHKTGFKGFKFEVNDNGAKERIYQRAARICTVIGTEGNIDLPPIIFPVREIILPKKAQETYDEAEEELFVSLEDDEWEIKNSATKTIACRQIASGSLYKPPPEGKKPPPSNRREWVDIHTAKLTALQELIEELQGKHLMIAYEFHHSLVNIKKMLKKNFKVNAPHIGSGVSTSEGARLEAAWNQGELPFLLLQPQSAALGLNLQGHGNDICVYEPTWSQDLYEQLYKRLHRNGVEGRVSVHNLIVTNTIEEVMLERVKEKDANQQKFKDAVRAYRERKMKKLKENA